MKTLTDIEISEFWLLGGLVASIICGYLGMKHTNYSPYYLYAFVLADFLTMLFLLIAFFKKKPQQEYKFDLSSGPPLIASALHWQAAVGALAVGWLIGDVFTFAR